MLGWREKHLAALTNAYRIAHGRRPLRTGGRLTRAAEQQAHRMARRSRVEHGSLFWSTGRRCWAQNVGVGPTVLAVHLAFVRSPEHRANLLNRCVTVAGYGVVRDAHGTIWATVNFG